ncbi:MAG: DUF951 domain-containing protein [Armatimonadetes bacterium]|nr:DUF951 domain-containing protein [Armatimonadota bacterium]
MAEIVRLRPGDVVRTRKAHPCGGDRWEIVRLGADVAIRCLRCGRRVLMPRVKLERRIKEFVHHAAAPDGAEATPVRRREDGGP